MMIQELTRFPDDYDVDECQHDDVNDPPLSQKSAEYAASLSTQIASNADHKSARDASNPSLGGTEVIKGYVGRASEACRSNTRRGNLHGIFGL